MAEREGSEQPQFSRKPRYQFVVREGIKAESVNEMLRRVFEDSGCTACGFLGIDGLLIRVRDDVLFGRFRDIEGVDDVSIVRGG